MANNATNVCESSMLNFLLTDATETRPTSWTLGLFTAVSDVEAASVTEVSGNGYSRQSITFSDSSNGSAISNEANVEFTASGGDWGTIEYVGVYDVTNSRWLMIGALDENKLVEDGDTFRVTAGDLSISLN